MGWFDRFRKPAPQAYVSEELREEVQAYKTALNRTRLAMERILDPDENKWAGTDFRAGRTQVTSSNLVEKITTWRQVANFPIVRRARKLYMQLIFAPGFHITLKRIKGKKTQADVELDEAVRQEWLATLRANAASWSLSETVDRAFRDGDCFIPMRELRPDGHLKLGFYDSEEIYDRDKANGTDNKGIETAPDDVTEVVSYTRYTSPTANPDVIPADQMVHIKVDVDVNEKRGQSRFDGLGKRVTQIEEFIDTEYTHRRLQSSIVIHKKIVGSNGANRLALDNSQVGSTEIGGLSVPVEMARPGMQITTGMNTEIEFKQPETNFSDATGIGRMLTRIVCQVTGFTYEMLSYDVSEGNLASTEVNETPVKDMIQYERSFFVARLRPLFERVIAAGLAAGRIAKFNEDEFEIEAVFAPPQPKDFLKTAQALNNLQMAKVISKSEAARSVNRDPELMQQEIEEESKKEFLQDAANNPDQAAKAGSSAGNAVNGGTNGGGNKPVSHSDNKGSGKT